MKYALSLIILFGITVSGCASSHIGLNAQLPSDQNISIEIKTTTENDS
jgi:hypothetical protein